jgi:hypothetical protein
VTTAATLWIATVIGLCLGGGQLGLGAIATGLGILTLWAMEWIDLRIPREHRAKLVVTTAPGARQWISAVCSPKTMKKSKRISLETGCNRGSFAGFPRGSQQVLSHEIFRAGLGERSLKGQHSQLTPPRARLPADLHGRRPPCPFCATM